MTAFQALADGARRVTRAPAVLIFVFLATLLAVLPSALFLRETMRAAFGNSLAAEEAVRGVNYQWWTEFSAAQPSGSLARTFSTSVIGFAAVLDNLSTLLDRGSRPAPVVMLGGAYALLWLFLAGGILDRYARDRPTRAHEFFSACGVFFVRFLRLAPLMGATYYLLFRYVYPWIFDRFYNSIVNDVTVERTAVFWRLTCYALFGSLLAIGSILFDYAKVRAVVEDRRSMLGSVGAGVRFIRRNAGAVALLYVLDGLTFVAVLLLYALAAPGAAGGAAAWVGLAVSHAYLAARLWTRLLFFASETALFQGRLAHIGYVAAPAAPLPEPPVVEQLLAK